MTTTKEELNWNRYKEGLCRECNKPNLQYGTYCLKHLEISKKKEYQEKLKDVSKIYVVGLHKSTNRYWDAGHWNRFSCYFVNENKEMERIFFGESGKVPHWDSKKYNFKNRVIGMDRIFDIVYGLGVYLFDNGYKFKEEFLSWSE